MRIVAHLRRAKADAREQRRHLLLALLGVGDAVDQQRLAHDVARRHARVERGERVLEDDLHLPPVGPQLGLRQADDLLALDLDRARGRLDEAQHGAAGRRLAAAATRPPGPSVSPAAYGEGDAVHRIDLADRAAQQALLHREVLLEVLDLDARGQLALTIVCQQAAQWPGCFSS